MWDVTLQNDLNMAHYLNIGWRAWACIVAQHLAGFSMLTGSTARHHVNV